MPMQSTRDIVALPCAQSLLAHEESSNSKREKACLLLSRSCGLVGNQLRALRCGPILSWLIFTAGCLSLLPLTLMLSGTDLHITRGLLLIL